MGTKRELTRSCGGAGQAMSSWVVALRRYLRECGKNNSLFRFSAMIFPTIPSFRQYRELRASRPAATYLDTPNAKNIRV
jgi:hypothetical protein